MILIDALYINKSGGKILLEYLISKLSSEKDFNKYLFILDDRLDSNSFELKINKSNLFILKANEKNRKKIFNFLLNQEKITTVFCFNNIPPPIKILNQKVFIYFHNSLLLETSESKYSFIQRIIFKSKNIYIRFNNRKNYYWLVQSNLIKELLTKMLRVCSDKILIMPFFKELEYNLNLPKKKQFLYVADGVPQKNINYLFIVWKILADQYQLYPELIVTISEIEFPQLINVVKNLQLQGIKITNLGICNYHDLMKVYEFSEYFVFPSLKESFGLPLIEASQMKCKIIAANLPYVNEAVRPSLTFDPYKPEELVNIVYQIMNKKIVLSDSKLVVKNSIDQIIQLIN